MLNNALYMDKNVLSEYLFRRVIFWSGVRGIERWTETKTDSETNILFLTFLPITIIPTFRPLVAIIVLPKECVTISQ